jgi:2-(1,2-epoxy-1,2-dihydrophenyl)acetyl-CoA isomerase
MSPVLFNIADRAARVTHNRLDARIAPDLPMARVLLDAAIRFDHDRSERCLALTGSGRMFSAGGDVAGSQAAGAHADAHLSELAGT